MKLNNIALALFTVAVLPTFAHAGPDPIRDSFDRDLNRNSEVKYVQTTSLGADPLDAINAALRAEPDPILASFERGFYREASAPQAVLANGEAGLLDVINAALRGKEADQVSASFWRDLNHGITACEYLNYSQIGATFAC